MRQPGCKARVKSDVDEEQLYLEMVTDVSVVSAWASSLNLLNLPSERPKPSRPTQYVGGAAQETAVEVYSALASELKRSPGPVASASRLLPLLPSQKQHRPFTVLVSALCNLQQLSQTQRARHRDCASERVNPPTVPIKSRESPSSDPTITSRCVASAFPTPN